MESDQNVIEHLIRQHLEDLHRAGVRQLPVANYVPTSDPSETVDPRPSVQPSVQPGPSSPPASEQQAVAPEAVTPEAARQDAVPHEAKEEVQEAIGPASETAAQAAPVSTESPAVVAATAQASPPLEAAPMETTPTNPNRQLSEQARIELLGEVDSRVKACQKCEELCTTRTQTVFGVGNPAARLVFLGEAPGADEDRLGEPFVGKAGQLLDKIIGACTLSRQEVYILNILKCRPPGNRNPTETEAENCAEFLQAQLDIIQPEYICCLGSVAAKNLLNTQTSIGRLRGKFHDWRGIKVLATYHPAYLLRNPSAKADVWKDMQFLMKEMGIELPKRSS